MTHYTFMHYLIFFIKEELSERMMTIIDSKRAISLWNGWRLVFSFFCNERDWNSKMHVWFFPPFLPPHQDQHSASRPQSQLIIQKPKLKRAEWRKTYYTDSLYHCCWCWRCHLFLLYGIELLYCVIIILCLGGGGRCNRDVMMMLRIISSSQ